MHETRSFTQHDHLYSDPRPVGLSLLYTLTKSLNNPALKSTARETLTYIASLAMTPFLEQFFAATMANAARGTAIWQGVQKPTIDLKQCSKSSKYPNYGKVGVEIDEYLSNLSAYYNGIYGTLGPDFSYEPMINAANREEVTPYDNVVEIVEVDTFGTSITQSSGPGLYWLFNSMVIA